VRKTWPFVLVLALAATACRAEMSLLIDVEESGSSTVQAEVGVDDEVLGLIGSLADGDSDIFAGLDFGVEGETEQRVEGDMTYYVTSSSFASATELVSSLNEGNGTGPFRELALTVDENGALLDATLAPLGSELDTDELPVDVSSLSGEYFSASVVVSLPGTVEEHNADEQLADGRLRWTIPITGGELDLHARSSYAEDDFPAWLVVVLLLGAGLAVALWVAATRRKRRAVNAIEATAAPPPSPFFEIDDTTPD